MATKPRRKTAKNSSLVPVLFTLGVIGWGFFAIDRLTSSSIPDYQLDSIEAHDTANITKPENSAWKKSAENFLSRFKKNDNTLVQDNREYDDWKAVSVDEDQPEQESTAIKKSSISDYSLFFYKDNETNMELIRLKFSDSNPLSYTEIFRKLVKGPENKKYLDSFPIKPTVIDAVKENDILVLNFDDNFGHGISFETAELQVKQIMKTAAQFKEVRYLKFKINSRDIENISVDGLLIPSRFKIN